MTTAVSTFKTGEKCPISGVYAFVKYADGSSWPQPTLEERRIPLTRGETFPPVRSTNKAAYWKLSRRT